MVTQINSSICFFPLRSFHSLPKQMEIELLLNKTIKWLSWWRRNSERYNPLSLNDWTPSTQQKINKFNFLYELIRSLHLMEWMDWRINKINAAPQLHFIKQFAPNISFLLAPLFYLRSLFVCCWVHLFYVEFMFTYIGSLFYKYPARDWIINQININQRSKRIQKKNHKINIIECSCEKDRWIISFYRYTNFHTSST